METSQKLRQNADIGAVASIPGLGSGQFYFGPARRGALKELWFGLSSGEACVLTGEAGLGKTLLCRELLRRLPSAVHNVYMLAPLPEEERNGHSLLSNIAQSVQLMSAAQDEAGESAVSQQDPASHLAVVIDEAQRLSVETLQKLAVWRHRQVTENRSVGLLLIGSPTLTRTLALPGVENLDLQMTVRCELPVFLRDETQAYIEHWLQSSMGSQIGFSDVANHMVHYATAGIPQEINQVCLNVVDAMNLKRDSSVTALTMARAIWKTLKFTADNAHDGEPPRQPDQTTTVIAVAANSDSQPPHQK